MGLRTSYEMDSEVYPRIRADGWATSILNRTRRNRRYTKPGLLKPDCALPFQPKGAIVPTVKHASLSQCGGARVAGRATCGAEPVVREGSPDGRTSKTKRCSARRRRTGHVERARRPSPAARQKKQAAVQMNKGFTRTSMHNHPVDDDGKSPYYACI